MIADDLAQEIRTLKQQPGDPIRSIGSIQLVKGMMELGLVDRLRLMVFPLILGCAGREPIQTILSGTFVSFTGNQRSTTAKSATSTSS